MNLSKKKPYVLEIAEIIYKNISKIKNKNPNIQTKEAINKFIETKTYDQLSSGRLHNQWFEELKKSNYIDKKTGEKIPEETIKLLEIQRDTMIKQLIKIPKLYDTKDYTLIDLSKRAHELLWRMCETYELWCKETKQKNELSLKIID